MVGETKPTPAPPQSRIGEEVERLRPLCIAAGAGVGFSEEDIETAAQNAGDGGDLYSYLQSKVNDAGLLRSLGVGTLKGDASGRRISEMWRVICNSLGVRFCKSATSDKPH